MGLCSLHASPVALLGPQRAPSQRQLSGATCCCVVYLSQKLLSQLINFFQLDYRLLCNKQWQTNCDCACCRYRCTQTLAWSRKGSAVVRYCLLPACFSSRLNPNEPAVGTAEDQERQPQYGVELAPDQWQPWDPLDLNPQYFAVSSCFFTACNAA